MKCPMTFNNSLYGSRHDCIGRECAWWVKKHASANSNGLAAFGCAVAFIAANGMRVASINGGESPDEYGEECDVDEVFGHSGAK